MKTMTIKRAIKTWLKVIKKANEIIDKGCIYYYSG